MADSTVGFNSCLEGCDPAVRAAASDEDVRLVEGLRSGAEEAYETLIARFEQPVYNLVFRLMGDATDVSDVVQDVFIKVFRNVNSFRGQSTLKTWIYRITVNEAHNRQRWFSRHRSREVGLEQEDESQQPYRDVLSDTGRSAFDLAADQESRTQIEEALGQLNPKFRAAVVLRDIDDLSYEEIAEVLQVSLGTVKSRILRGREALRKILVGRLEPGLVVA